MKRKKTRKSMKKYIAAFAFIALVAGAGIIAWNFTSSPEPDSGAAESIILGGLVSDANALIFTAEDQHFFAANGINFGSSLFHVGKLNSSFPVLR
jgi:ABC-type nitrate/sulfonate/bicarbonate transport system substrate-binding protein